MKLIKNKSILTKIPQHLNKKLKNKEKKEKDKISI